METTTRFGSRVMIDHQDEEFLYGRWFDGQNIWYPARWYKDGSVWGNGHFAALDLELNA